MPIYIVFSVFSFAEFSVWCQASSYVDSKSEVAKTDESHGGTRAMWWIIKTSGVITGTFDENALKRKQVVVPFFIALAPNAANISRGKVERGDL